MAQGASSLARKLHLRLLTSDAVTLLAAGQQPIRGERAKSTCRASRVDSLATSSIAECRMTFVS